MAEHTVWESPRCLTYGGWLREHIDPDCRDGKHRSCVGGPCECDCHRETTPDTPAVCGECAEDMPVEITGRTA